MSSRNYSEESEWRSCTSCALSESRRSVVLRGRGRVRSGSVDREKCSVYWNRSPSTEQEEALLTDSGPLLLFVGEAPGEHEDIVGVPFQGEAGRVFNWCLSLCNSTFHFDVTNMVACRPSRWSNKQGYKMVNRPPLPPELKACRPRLDSLFDQFPYEGLVYLGTVAKDFKVRGMPTVSLLHPSFILRKEYKLVDAKRFAKKLDAFITQLGER